MPVSDPMPILQFLAKHELTSSVWWRCDGKFAPITFLLNMNDVFAWACADAEELTLENLPVFEQAVKDCMEACDVGEAYAPNLFAARIRKMRPQGAAYPPDKELWPLFDAAGPVREIGLGNPYGHPGDNR